MSEPEATNIAVADGIPVHCAFDQLVDVVSLVPNPRNPNKHGDKQTELLARVIQHQGWRAPIVVSKLSGYIVAGHGRLQAAKHLGVCHVPVNFQQFDSPADEDAHLLADNRIAELAELDLEEVQSILDDIKDDIDLTLTGFNEEEAVALLAGQYEVIDPEFTPRDGGKDGDEDDEELDPDKGSLLHLLNISVAEPKHEVANGEMWAVGPHFLFIGSVLKDHQKWIPLIERAGPGAVFVPHPSPMTPVGKVQEGAVLVMVQPEPYFAGHLLDRYVEVNGEASVSRIS